MASPRNPETPDCILHFDGGSTNNPGFGYGSFQLTFSNGGSLLEQLEFGQGVSNNQAEYRALIGGLHRLTSVLQVQGKKPAEMSLEVRGDSALVINQLRGAWKVRNAGLVPLHAEARKLLAGFGRTNLEWVPRSFSVSVLGH